MTARDKKMIKALAVLIPLFLLATWYGYSQVRGIQTRRAAQRQKAQIQAQQTQNEPTTVAADPGTKAPPPPPPGATPADNHASVPTAALRTPLLVTADLAAQSARLQLPWRRDPFVPPDSLQPARARAGTPDLPLVLRGISWDGASGIALINRDVVAEGDSLHGYSVVKVTPNSVTLQRKNQEVVLQLKE